MNSTIPMPSSKWVLRIAVPLIVLGLAAALLITAGWRALRPATEVQAVTVVVRSVQTDEPMTHTRFGWWNHSGTRLGRG